MDTPLRNDLAVLHLEAPKEHDFDVDVLEFTVEEGLSAPFTATVDFLSFEYKMPFDDIVGRGAALSVHTAHGAGERVWAGICTELELVNSELHVGALEGLGLGLENYKGASRYRLVIRPALWRLSLRKNCRIFQKKTTVEIVKAVLEEWDIEIEDKDVSELHVVHEYKVQYHESDLAFVSRLLEEEGITYVVLPAPQIPEQEKPGREVTTLRLSDKLHTQEPYFPANGVISYVGDRLTNAVFSGRQMWALRATQRPRPAHVFLRDRNFRGRGDRDPDNQAKETPPGKAHEEKYEVFTYQPGVFWSQVDKDPPNDALKTPVADDRVKARTNMELIEDKSPNAPSRAKRLVQEQLRDRTVIHFHADVLELDPGVVFSIGEDSPMPPPATNHPHKEMFGPTKKLLVVGRKVWGRDHGAEFESECTAVFAENPYRPARATAKPRIYGIQSALVVGPKGKEIYTDEFGRVRVQFPWDREGKFDDKSSCWLRVSQAWAGGGFGFVAIPRVGHEVLVAFFEGDPDQPVIVGRAYNATTRPPYFPVTKSDGFGDNWTKTAIRTDTSPHQGQAAGYNELLFQDQRGRERIHIQAQKDHSIIVNDSESRDVGNNLSYRVGVAETHQAGALFSVQVGKAGACTNLVMTPTSIVLTTGQASLTLIGKDIALNALGKICVHAEKKMFISSKKEIDVDVIGKMTIDTKDKLLLNCQTPKPHDVKVVPAAPAMPPAHGSTQGPPFLPDPAGPDPEKPGGFDEAKVGLEVATTDTSAPMGAGAAGSGIAAMLGESFSGLASTAENALAGYQTAASMLGESGRAGLLASGLGVAEQMGFPLPVSPEILDDVRGLASLAEQAASIPSTVEQFASEGWQLLGGVEGPSSVSVADRTVGLSPDDTTAVTSGRDR